MALVIDGLTKRFGEIQALDGVTFTVEQGGIFGFLGANGAGKTTTMRIVLGFLRADAGQATWNGRDTRQWPRGTWGYMPEDRGLYLRMPVLDQLVFFGSLYGLSRRDARTEALEWLARFRIAEHADRKAESLSKGNQQKVGEAAPWEVWRNRSSVPPTCIAITACGPAPGPGRVGVVSGRHQLRPIRPPRPGQSAVSARGSPP
jgi:ABC-type multidrug transport system ATPase subunit